MATAAAIGPSGPRVHQQRGGGARLTRTLVIVVGAAIAAALLVAVIALHSDSPESNPATRHDDAAAVTSSGLVVFAPLYSKTRTSGNEAVWLNTTVTVLAPAAMLFA